MRELNPRAWIPSLNRYATGYDDLYYHRQMNGEGEWWCYPAGEDEPVVVEIELPTGLKDKNGKEIYEGDVVNIQGIKYYVDFEHGGFWFNNDNRKWKANRPFTHFQEINDTEVIGNIHEQPELLEAKDVD